MSIFDKFKKSKEEEAVSNQETAKVDVVKKTVKTKKATEVKEVKTENKTEKNQPVQNKASKSYGVLIRPLITEKATNLGKQNQYVFEVSVKSNKIQVAQAIEARYGVKPVRVNILNNSGKVIRRGRNLGKTKDWKKAIIALPEGKNIQIHEGV